MIQAGINGNKYDNMNPKTLSEPQNEPLNNENDTIDYEDGGHYSKNVDRKGGQKIQNDTQNDTQETKNDTQG